MKKESLSVITVKILLAVLLFAGIGTIIIGGGYIVGKWKSSAPISSIPIEGCAKAGEGSSNPSLGPSAPNPRECCEGLLEIYTGSRYEPGNEYANEVGCIHLEGSANICSDCGNGICESWENRCNCLEDCVEEINTSDWQTYRNEEFEFEFDCFSEWKINVGKIITNEKGEQRQLISIDNLEILSGDVEISFNIRENVSLENVLQAEKSLNCYNVISGNEQKNECSFCSVNESNIVVAGYNGKKIVKISKEIKCKEKGNCENLCIDHKIRTVIFQKDNNVYTLNTFGGEQPLENFNQILSTFKFIEK